MKSISDGVNGHVDGLGSIVRRDGVNAHIGVEGNIGRDRPWQTEVFGG